MQELVKERLIKELGLLSDFYTQLPVLDRFSNYIVTEQKDGSIIHNKNEVEQVNNAFAVVEALAQKKEKATQGEDTEKIQILTTLVLNVSAVELILMIVLRSRFFTHEDMEESKILDELVIKLKDLYDELVLLADINELENNG